MAEQSGSDKFIKCTNCKCKYINEPEHIKTDFGYSRLNERYKTCVKCRTRNNAYSAKHKEQRAEYAKSYREANKEAINEKNRQRDKEVVNKLKQLEDDNNKCCRRCRKLKPIQEFISQTCNTCRTRDEHRVWSEEWKIAEYLKHHEML